MSKESITSMSVGDDVGGNLASLASLYSSSDPNPSIISTIHAAAASAVAGTQKGVKVECIYTELARLRELVLEKDKEIARLQRETHKLKSVIEKSELRRLPSLSSYQQIGVNHPTKKCGVSGESWAEDPGDSLRSKQPERHYKDFRSRQLIRAALSDNDFLKNLDSEQVRDIVDFMHPQSFSPGSSVIQEGEPGSHLYVSAEGQLEVAQDNRYLGTLGPGKAFGELALLYNCKRTATVRAITECKVWTLERRAFQVAMVKAGMRRMEDRLSFLRSVPVLRGLQQLVLARIADCLEVEYYPAGTCIIREGTAGHTFFIISQGRVRVTTSDPPVDPIDGTLSSSPIITTSGRDPSGNPTNTYVLRELSRGDYFGEQALLREDRRSANVIALPPGVECLTLDGDSFMQLIGDLSEFHQHRKSPYNKRISLTTVPGPTPVQTTSSASSSVSTTGTPCTRPVQLLHMNDLEVKYGDDDDSNDDQHNRGCLLAAAVTPAENNNSSSTSAKTPAIDIPISTTTVDLPPSTTVTPAGFDSQLSAVKDADFDFSRLRLDDLEVVATLGVGGFGRVELVQVVHDTNRVYALKCLAKAHILATQQQEHVYAERNIMMSCKSPFIASTFKDAKCVYLLMEACLGGEIWTILRDKGSFDEDTTRFVAACVVLALEYLHEKDVIYRDLKPENLMVANDGYVKLVDFGFSKVVPSGQRTWTFCGTPEYVAPEVILNRGHDRTVDYWALGVLLFELLSGLPPWGPMSADASPSDSSDPLITYNQILKGIDTINFPKNLSRGGVSLIRRLCRQVPGERLGAQRGTQDIMAHRWFQGFDWDGLRGHKMKPPIKPRLRGPRDTTNFDKFELDIEDTPDDLSGWDIDF